MAHTSAGLVLALALAGPIFADVPQINLSEDLVSLGIARQNLLPDQPALDARPLFQAALKFAANNGTHLITVNPGAYYFLTPQAPDRYLQLDSVTDLTIDLQGSDLYLAKSEIIGFVVIDSSRVTLTNFSLDIQQLPFTQVRLTAVSGRTLQYTTLTGWPSPTAFNTINNPGGVAENLSALVFRDGELIAATNQLPLQRPLQAGILQVVTGDSPWTQPGVLATYQPGDTIVVMARGGEAPLYIAGGDQVTLQNITVYASAAIAVHLDSTANALVEHVHVIPRPGMGRLISSNADGIHLSYVQAGNKVRFSQVERTVDDGIAINSPFLAFVQKQTGTRQITVTRNFNSIFANGLHVSFVDPSTGLIVGSANVVSQSPPYSDPLTSTVAPTLTFDQNLPTLASGFGMIYADAANRGAGSIIENNAVRDVYSARGIYVGGVAGVTIRTNTIHGSNCGAIVVHQDLSSYPVGPAQDIKILSNVIQDSMGPQAVGTGAIEAIASIFVLSTDQNFNFIAGTPNTGVTIAGNRIVNSGRSAIWVGNVGGGSVFNNNVTLYYQHPELALWGVSSSIASQLLQDFKSAIVLHASSNVTVQGNTQ